MVDEKGLSDQAVIDSAGTHSYHIGEAPDPRTEGAAMNRGYSLIGQTARQIEPEDFERFDLILAMDRGHRTYLNRVAPPGRTDRVRMFMGFASGYAEQDVPDPYYGGPDGFENVLDMIEAGSRGLLAALAARVRA
jgi:protein-tyrosine phosphatase